MSLQETVCYTIVGQNQRIKPEFITVWIWWPTTYSSGHVTVHGPQSTSKGLCYHRKTYHRVAKSTHSGLKFEPFLKQTLSSTALVWPDRNHQQCLRSSMHTRGEYTSLHREWYQDWSYEDCVVVSQTVVHFCNTFGGEFVPRNLGICAILRLRCAFSESQDCVTRVRNLEIA